MNTAQLSLNAPLPAFTALPSTEVKLYASDDFTSEILIIAFTCNHCPYVQAYESRMIALQREYSTRGVQLVAINSNNEQNYPEDNFDRMVERAGKLGFNFPYLRDANQSVAESFGATHTPQFFLFDKQRLLRYSGKMDDSWKDASLAKKHYLRDAIEAVLSGKEISIPETYSIGCTIKWK